MNQDEPQQDFRGELHRCPGPGHISTQDLVPRALSLITDLEVHQLHLGYFQPFWRFPRRYLPKLHFKSYTCAWVYLAACVLVQPAPVMVTTSKLGLIIFLKRRGNRLHSSDTHQNGTSPRKGNCHRHLPAEHSVPGPEQREKPCCPCPQGWVQWR